MSAITAEPIPARRLTLVPLSAGHAREMAAVLADPELYTFTGGSPPSVQELRARYERWTAGSPDPAVSWCNWVIQLRDPGCLAGTVQATITTGEEPAAEIAWVVGTPWQGQGVATAAAQALITWLGQRSIKTVIAHIHPRHQASAAVAAAAGLAPTGQLRDGEMRWHLTVPPTLPLRGISRRRRAARSGYAGWPPGLSFPGSQLYFRLRESDPKQRPGGGAEGSGPVSSAGRSYRITPSSTLRYRATLVSCSRYSGKI